jgi:hypothetical protein
MGYTLLDAGSYTAAYGTDAQDHLYVIKGGQLLHMDADGVQTLLATGINGTIFSWGEDPNNNVYFTSNGGSNGIITNDVRYLPLSLPIPTFVDAGVVDSGTWEYRPFNLGARYTQNAMQLMATYVMADGREGPPSETITLEVTPEVKLMPLSRSRRVVRSRGSTRRPRAAPRTTSCRRTHARPSRSRWRV